MAPEDQEAARLYDAYGPSLYRYALMILASPEAAEDVIQQVFVSLLGRKRVRIGDEERYLRRAVRNGCYSVLRQQKVRGAASNADRLLESATTDPAGISTEDRLALAGALRQLPAVQREVVHLHVFEGRTFKDLAEIIGESPNTLASRYRYALANLKAALSQGKP